ncbi:ILK kinase, partial [Polyodon spathula]|nr:ILK kinase [Polyodon spathula]
MDDIFTQCREGNAVAVRLWLDNTENDLNQGWNLLQRTVRVRLLRTEVSRSRSRKQQSRTLDSCGPPAWALDTQFLRLGAGCSRSSRLGAGRTSSSHSGITSASAYYVGQMANVCPYAPQLGHNSVARFFKKHLPTVIPNLLLLLLLQLFPAIPSPHFPLLRRLLLHVPVHPAGKAPALVLQTTEELL